MPNRAPAAAWLVVLTGALLLVFGSAAGAHGARAHPRPQAQAQAQAADPGQPAQAPTPEQVAASPATQMGMPEMAMSGMAMDEDPPVWGTTFFGRVLNWLGMWHVAVVHFPIALFVIVAVVEAAARITKKPEWAGSDRLLVAIAAISAVLAVGLGWLTMGPDIAKDDFLHRAHRILGTTLAALALLTWWAKERSYKLKTRGPRAAYYALLGLTIVAVVVNAFFGASLVHGGMSHLMFK